MTEFNAPTHGQPELEGFPEVPEVDTTRERAHGHSSRPYRARYTDTTDRSLSAMQDGLQSSEEVPEEPLVIRKERQAFVSEAFSGHKSISDYLADHPEQIALAKHLKLIE